MPAKREYRGRSDVQVAVLDALVEREGEGMTVLELRTRVDAEIDRIEEALETLKQDGLIAVEREESRVLIRPDDRVVPEAAETESPSLVDRLRDRFPL